MGARSNERRIRGVDSAAPAVAGRAYSAPARCVWSVGRRFRIAPPGRVVERAGLRPRDPMEALWACARVAASVADSGVFVRLSFPKGEHRDVIVQSGEVTVGSAPDNNVVLTADGTQPRLATIIIDQRGYTLVVSTPDA